MASYLLWSLFKGKRASANPWQARGLEWETASPPPTENFLTTPVVTQEAYAYDQPSVTAPVTHAENKRV
jgi:cytochrome c oxidase subunit 1